MIDYLEYNLTEYKAFRQLELEYIKTLTLNQSLQAQMDTLKQAFNQKCSEVLQLKNQEMKDKIKIQNNNLRYKKLYKQLLQQIESTLSCFKGSRTSPKGIKLSQENREQTKKNRSHDIANKSHISQQPSIDNSALHTSHQDKSILIDLQQSQTLQKVFKKLTQMSKQHQSLKQKNTTLTKRIQTFESLYKTQSFEKQKAQMMIVKQVQHLETQLEQLNQVNIELQAKINIKEKQKRKVEVEVRHFKQENLQLQQKISQLLKENQEKSNQDTQFAIDFMTFQLHTIRSIYIRLTEQTKCSTQLSSLMSLLYSDFQQLSQIFRQKLQIQYDLQELQQRYKSMKSSSRADQTLLIETRRQIQAFRLQLLKQKEILRQKQQFIEEHFGEYTQVNEQEMKIKNYSYELQNRLYKQKRSGVETSEKFITSRNPTARQILLRRMNDLQKLSQTNTNTKNIRSGTQDFLKHDGQEETVDKEDSSSMPSKKNSLRFKQTHNAEQIMNEIIKKDKANMEKILKDTRKTPIPIYLGK